MALAWLNIYLKVQLYFLISLDYSLEDKVPPANNKADDFQNVPPVRPILIERWS